VAKKPTDLSREWWKKNKPLTLKSTGLGEALGKWATALAAVDDRQKRNLAAFKTAEDALDTVTAKVKVAKDACNKTLHGDAIAALEAYKGLIKTAGDDLATRKTTYQENLVKFKERKAKGTEEATKFKNETQAKLIAKTDGVVDVCNKSVTVKNVDAMRKSAALANKCLGELNQARVAAIKIISAARKSAPTEEAVHTDDVGDQAAKWLVDFNVLTNEIHGARGDAEGRLKEAIKACGAEPEEQEIKHGTEDL
jgi:hypothetical protein